MLTTGEHSPDESEKTAAPRVEEVAHEIPCNGLEGGRPSVTDSSVCDNRVKATGSKQTPNQDIIIYTKPRASPAVSARTKKKKPRGFVRNVADAATATQTREVQQITRKQLKALSRAATGWLDRSDSSKVNAPGATAMAKVAQRQSNGYGLGKANDDTFISKKKSLSLNVDVALENYQVLFNGPITPLTETVFPGQSFFAEAHAEWNSHKLTIEYQPTVTNFTSPNGLVWMVFAPDATSSAPSSLSEIQAMTYRASGRPYESFKLDIPPSGWKYTGAQTDLTQAPNNIQHGRLFIISDLTGSTLGNVGKLQVTSHIAFRGFRKPLAAAAAISTFNQVNIGAKPITAKVSTGEKTLPGADGEGSAAVYSATGLFEGTTVGWEASTSHMVITIPSLKDRFSVGTVLCIVRNAGRQNSAAKLVDLKGWSDGPATTYLLNAYAADYNDNLGYLPFMAFGPNQYTGSIGSMANPAQFGDAVSGNSNSMSINYLVVTNDGSESDAVIHMHTPSAVNNTVTNFADYGWQVNISIAGFDLEAAQFAKAKPVPFKSMHEMLSQSTPEHVLRSRMCADGDFDHAEDESPPVSGAKLSESGMNWVLPKTKV